MFSLLWTLIVGLVVGAIAKLIMPGRDPGGITDYHVLGVVGSFIGTYVGRFLGSAKAIAPGSIMSIFGAIIVLGIYRLIVRQSRHTLSARTYAGLSWYILSPSHP